MTEGAPRYVAIITDGNGRRRGLDVGEGHRAGAETVRARLRDAVEFGIRELTIYVFSTENWERSALEIEGLMNLMAEYIDNVTPELHAEGVQLRFTGRRSDPVPRGVIERMEWAEAMTAETSGSPSSSPSTTAAGPRSWMRRDLYAPDMHDPELLIRTGGECRLSNYMLWQHAYSELGFSDEMWPILPAFARVRDRGVPAAGTQTARTSGELARAIGVCVWRTVAAQGWRDDPGTSNKNTDGPQSQGTAGYSAIWLAHRRASSKPR